jgi:hypothetical protein
MLLGMATASGLDLRDLEAGLVRLALAHRRSGQPCPGCNACRVLIRARHAG